MSKQIVVKADQLWQDNSPDNPALSFKILRVNKVTATCKIICSAQENVGRELKIRLDKFESSVGRYTLVKE
jgi:hypothetical protein